MPLSGWEILIIALIVLVFFGYKRLPEIGRSAGEGARQLKDGLQRKGGEARAYAEEKGPEAKAYVDEKAAQAKGYVSERTPDAGEVGRTAGKHVREYRELKEEIMSTPKREEPKPKDESE
jgi:sec-independent protein translocase protein TatA